MTIYGSFFFINTLTHFVMAPWKRLLTLPFTWSIFQDIQNCWFLGKRHSWHEWIWNWFWICRSVQLLRGYLTTYKITGWISVDVLCRLKEHGTLLTQTQVPVHGVIRENRCACCVSVPLSFLRGLDWHTDSKLQPGDVATWKYVSSFNCFFPNMKKKLDVFKSQKYTIILLLLWTNI